MNYLEADALLKDSICRLLKNNIRRLLQGSSITIIISSIIIVIIVVSDLPVLFENGMFIPPFSKRPASIRCVLKSFVPVHRKTKKNGKLYHPLECVL